MSVHTTHTAIFSDSDQKDNSNDYLSKIYGQDGTTCGVYCKIMQ